MEIKCTKTFKDGTVTTTHFSKKMWNKLKSQNKTNGWTEVNTKSDIPEEIVEYLSKKKPDAEPVTEEKPEIKTEPVVEPPAKKLKPDAIEKIVAKPVHKGRKAKK